MASLIDCPHCGLRPKEEFSIRGAARRRPAPEAGEAAWLDYIYLRANPRGPVVEHWHHFGGCRQWLAVTRDTASHSVLSVEVAVNGGRGADRE